jgi:hypothetical protein
MAITGTPERSYYDGYEQRNYWTVEAIERWLADCTKRRDRYMGKLIKVWSGTYEVIDVVFTDPGLIGWVLYQDGNEIKKLREDQTFSKIVEA